MVGERREREEENVPFEETPTSNSGPFIAILTTN